MVVSTEAAIPTLGQVVGQNVQRLRWARRWTQSFAARHVQQAGGQWTRSQLASVESGRRADVEVHELLALAAAFGEPLAAFYEGSGKVVTTERSDGTPVVADLGAIRQLLSGERPFQAAEFIGLPPTDGETRAAKRLGYPMERVFFAARRLWDGRTLEEERDRRLGDRAAATPSVTAYRGRITRQLMDELQHELLREEAQGGQAR
jgi:transcriptional regulator with XRE-family HTH domain